MEALVRQTGRPTKYTPECHAKIVQAIRVGSTQRLACAYAGISEDTLAIWKRRYSALSDAIKEAEGAAAVGWLAKIEQASVESWQAAAWKLERRYPAEYGRSTVELTGRNGGAITVDVSLTAGRRSLEDRLDQFAASIRESISHKDVDADT